jgi:hypothetical protein
VARLEPRAFAIATMACSIAAVSCGTPPGAREPTRLETALVGLALDLESPEVCAKISPSAFSRAPFNSPGTRTSYERSRCFFYVATRTLDGSLCGEVRQAGSRRSGGHFSAETCTAEIAGGRRYTANLGFDIELVLRALGYTEADVPEGDWVRFYFDVRTSPELRRRLASLPNPND